MRRPDALQQRRPPTASCHSNPIGVIAGSGYIVRELSFSPKETRIHKWDQEFESAFLQRRVRNEPCGGCRRYPRADTGTQEEDRQDGRVLAADR
jgi:hypothetical protein